MGNERILKPIFKLKLDERLMRVNELQLERFKPLALIVLSGILYGSLGYLGVKIFAEDISVSSMLFWRFLIASLWMFGVSWNKSKSLFTAPDLRTYFPPLSICAISYGLGSMFYFLASRTAGTGLAMVVFFSYPMFVALHTYYFKKWQIDKFTLSALIAIPIGLFLLMERNSAMPNTTGIIFAILSALTYAIYILKSKSLLKIFDTHRFTLIVCLFSAILFFIAAWLGGDLDYPTSLRSFGYLCAIGIFATALPIQLLMEGLKEISALKASMASVLEPIVTLLIGIVLLSESVTVLQIIGSLTILASSLFIQIARE